jgi:hypothetical protein
MLRFLALLMSWHAPEVHRPSWGTRLEARLAACCALCQHKGHTTQEHVRVPQKELLKR